jgi:hypothetical protein
MGYLVSQLLEWTGLYLDLLGHNWWPMVPGVQDPDNYLNFLHMYCKGLRISELLLGQRRQVAQRMRWVMMKLNHYNDYWHQSHLSRNTHTNLSSFTVSGAHEQNDNQVCFHLQWTAHRSTSHWVMTIFVETIRKAEAPFTFLYLLTTYSSFTPS